MDGVLNFAKGHGTRNDFVLVTVADDARPVVLEPGHSRDSRVRDIANRA
jgi:diaminopimelate epimerase